MKHQWIVLSALLAAVLLVGPAYSVFTDMATSRGNAISSGEFDIAISKDGARFYNNLKLFDFSDLKQGDSKDVVFYVKNRGDIPVSKLTMTLHVTDLEDGSLSPAEAEVDSTPDVGELSGNLEVTAMTVEVNGKVLNVDGAVGKTLAELNGGGISIPLEDKIAPGETAKVTMKIEFSKEAGNECQTDSVNVDMELTAEQ
jgi:spore coat-associated protein N